MIFQLKNVAAKARKQLIKFSKEYPECGDNKTMQGYCAIASWLVHGIAKSHGLKISMIGGQAFVKIVPNDITTNHVWCEGYGHVVDITVQQFRSSFPAIYIIPKNQYYNTALNQDLLMIDLKNWSGVNSPLHYRKELEKLIKEAA